MKFVVFEGLDGAGKSTLIEALKTKILARGESVTLTREPGGTPLGDEIREMLLRTDAEAPCPRAELLLYEAGRAHHVDTVIEPARSRGEWVICDRFYASTVAFQVGGRGLDAADIDWLNRYAVNGCEPDLWILLDLTTTEAKKRMAGRNLDRFESEKEDFHERVRQSYLQLAKSQKEKWLVLDAAKSKEQLTKELFHYFEGRKWL
ncbi:MAG: dTMP kinase [Bdellovibrionales bacterium]|nr:dTMP kinase [Bdellovibrionales bacterium]